jgi:hypothetical protein
MRDQGAEVSLCQGLMRTASGDGEAYTTLVSFDLNGDDRAATTATASGLGRDCNSWYR